MSDEERKTPLTGDEPTGAVHWEGPKNKKWPQALGAPSIRPVSAEEPKTPPAEKAPPPEQSAEKRAAGEKPPEKKKAPAKTAPAKKRKKKSVRRPVGRPQDTEKKRRRSREEPPDPWEEERNYRPIRTRRDGRIGCLGGLMYATFIISLSIVLAAFLWMAASDVLALNKEAVSVEVTLPADAFHDKQVDVKDEDGNVTGSKTVRAADIKTVAAILKDNGLINYKWLFELYSSFSNADTKLDPGTYALTSNLDYRALVTRMHIGADAQLQTLVTFPEGFNMDQIFARLEENGVCSREALYEAAATTEFSYGFLEQVETGDPYRLEGFLYPDTYYFYQGMQASSAINKFLSNMHYHVTDEMWQRTASMNLTFRQVMTVASLIEKEAANDSERPLIASVVYNRLNQGMPLQFDSTVVYALREQGITELSPEIIQAAESPYNTYLNGGLPPGPICSPGMPSITAALNPAQTNYLFFALDKETNTMEFFTNYNDFTNFSIAQGYVVN